MIDGVGKSGAGRVDVARQEKGQSLSGVAGPQTARGESPVKSAVLDLVATGAPVDTNKVDAIRNAIAQGRYQVDPDRIAARMLEDLTGRN